jgi:hypothetical protein
LKGETKVFAPLRGASFTSGERQLNPIKGQRRSTTFKRANAATTVARKTQEMMFFLQLPNAPHPVNLW